MAEIREPIDTTDLIGELGWENPEVLKIAEVFPPALYDADYMVWLGQVEDFEKIWNWNSDSW